MSWYSNFSFLFSWNPIKKSLMACKSIIYSMLFTVDCWEFFWILKRQEQPEDLTEVLYLRDRCLFHWTQFFFSVFYVSLAPCARGAAKSLTFLSFVNYVLAEQACLFFQAQDNTVLVQQCTQWVYTQMHMAMLNFARLAWFGPNQTALCGQQR